MTVDTAKEREKLVGLERRVLFGCWGCDQANEPTARPARDLAVTPIGRLTPDKEELICEYCWYNATSIDDPRFSDLTKFDPFAGYRTALDVIDAQAAEIERLKEVNEDVLPAGDYLEGFEEGFAAAKAVQAAEIENLRDALERIAQPHECGCRPICRCYEGEHAQAYADTVREIAQAALSEREP